MHEDSMQEATWALFNLCINLGLIASVVDQYPEHVQEGFRIRLEETKDWAERQIEEVQMFGEAFDDGSEEG